MNREPQGADPCRDEELRMAVGALALGALDPDEAVEVRRHLAECPECQEEYASFVGVKRVMDIGLVGAPMPEVVPVAPGGNRRRPPFRSRTPEPFGVPRRRRVLLGATGFAAAFALVVGGFWAGHEHRPGGGTLTALPAVTQSGVTAQISYEGLGWGTTVKAKMSGTPDGLNCTLFVVAKNHAAIQLSNWKSVAGKQIDVPAATALTPGQIDHFEVKVAGWGGYDIMVPMTS